MHVLVIFAHPEPRSFNGALRDVAVETFRESGHAVTVSDLYALGFDPVESARHFRERRDPTRFAPQSEQRHAWEHGTTAADVRAEIGKLDRADLVLFQYPLWWFAMPAILKGWLDRVLVYGGLYTGTMRFDRGRFLGKRAMLSVTSGSPGPANEHDGRNADVHLVLWPMHYSLHYVGFDVLPPFVATGVGSSARQRLETHESDLRAHLESLDARPPIRFNLSDDYDASARLKPGAPSYSPFIRHHATQWRDGSTALPDDAGCA